MNKLPWFKFFPADWIKGTRDLSSQEKAVWIDLLAYMWEAPSRGQITSTWEGLARMTGISWLDCQKVINGMSQREILNVTERDGLVTIMSRRLKTEENKRESDRLRQRDHRKSVTSRICHTVESEVRIQKTDKDNYLVDLPAKPDRPTAEDLVKLWNKEAHPNLPRVKFLTEVRKRHANARLQANPEQTFWNDLIIKVNLSPLLRGEAGTWKATFDWVLNPSNLAKILEGNYDPGKRR